MKEKNSKKFLLVILVLIVAIVASGIGGYQIGKNTESVKQQEDISEYKEEIEKYQEEEETFKEQMEVVEELNRSELDGLGKIEGPIYVSGHIYSCKL